jgi:PEP-CTERM motif
MRRSFIVVAALFVLTLVQPANATPISFAFGISSDITVPANERVLLPGVLINTGSNPIVFDELVFLAWGFTAGPGEGTDALHVEFPGSSEQFDHVALALGEMFSFTFASIQFDPSLVTVLHPILSFQMTAPGEKQLNAFVPVTITAGDELVFGPLKFENAPPIPAPVPEPATFVMMVSVGAAAGLSRLRRRLITRRRGISKSVSSIG